MLKLKFQYFGHLMRRADSFEKTLMLEGIGQSCEIHVSVKQRNDALRRIPELSLSHVKAQSVLLSVVVGSWNHSFICAINKPLAEMCFNNVKDFGTYHCS